MSKEDEWSGRRALQVLYNYHFFQAEKVPFGNVTFSSRAIQIYGEKKNLIVNCNFQNFCRLNTQFLKIFLCKVLYVWIRLIESV